MSGYLNNPPRTILIESDNRPGSYPTLTSPVDAARSSEFNKPFRDTITMETPVVYGRSSVNFSDVPSSSDYIEIDNANGVTNKFVFSNAPSTFVISSNTYSVDMRGVRSTVGNVELGLNARQVSINNAARRFITAVNLATGSFIAAAPGTRTSEVILTQNIPGAFGNTSNTSSTVKVTISNFTGGRDTHVRYPYGVYISDGNAAMSEVVRRVISTSRSGTLDVPTSGDSRLVEGYAEQHGFGAFSPFDESNSHQSFGIAGVRRDSNSYSSKKYGTQTENYDQFLTRGSISGSLDESLRVKDKIVIDLTPVEKTTIASKDSPGENFPMAYFNFQTKKWERIGFGIDPTTAAGGTSIQDELDSNYTGFGLGAFSFDMPTSDFSKISIIDPNIASTFTGKKRLILQSGWSTPTDIFGFPFHPKYHATSSQVLDTSTLIDRPFILEKIVYEFSGSSENADYIQSQGFGKGVSHIGVIGSISGTLFNGATFFILNQRKAKTDQNSSYNNFYYEYGEGGMGPYDPPTVSNNFKRGYYESGGIPQNRSLSTGASNNYVDSIRDLVTFARVGTVWPTYDQEVVETLEEGFPHPAQLMDLAVVVPASGTLDGHYTVSSNVKTSTNIPATAVWEFISQSAGSAISAYVTRDSSTRNAIDIPTGRSITSEFCGPEITFVAESNLGNPTNRINYGIKIDNFASPYLLMPGDKLIFGWQSLVGLGGASYNGPYFSIGTGSGKLILYGSYLRDDKPVHNIYKDQLNSDAAHETVPPGPSVLDRFETEPQMTFSGSMREEHITGTMLTRNSDGSLSVTNVNNFNIGGVRAVSARVSDGNVRQRWSFFRNTRLVDSEEQYYDSMQPNPLDVLFPDTSVKAYGISTTSYILLMLPDETFKYIASKPNTENAINTYSNRSFLLGYPFSQNLSSIPRVKKINSNVFTGKRVPSFFVDGSDNVTFGTTVIQTGLMFVTGTVGGNKGVSKLSAPGGLTKNGLVESGVDNGQILPFTARESDTNPIRIDQQPLTRAATDAQTNVNYWMSRFMGCFGDGYGGLIQCKPFVGGGGLLIVKGQIYRGTKHGLINPTPFFSNAVFNGTTYGQFRDMMEQRQYTRFSLGDNTLTDSAVEVVFINRSAVPGTLNITSGSATNSSNISKNATSEHPYDDALSDYDQIWDRETALPESLISL